MARRADRRLPAVTGSTEGDYIHVGVIGRDGAYQTLLIAKTFAGGTPPGPSNAWSPTCWGSYLEA